MVAEGESSTPGAIDIRPTRADAEKAPPHFYRLLEEFRGRDLLPLKRIAELCGDTSLNPEPNILRKIQNRTLSDQARIALLNYIFDDQSMLFGRARRQAAAIEDAFYFSFLNFLDAKDAVQDQARAQIVGTYKMWRYSLDHEDELLLGKLTVGEDPRTRALKVDVRLRRKSADGLRGSQRIFLGHMVFVSRMYFMITHDARSDDLRMTLFSRFRLDDVGTDLNANSVFAGRRHHIANMDGFTLGIDSNRIFVSPIHVSLVEEVDELDRLDQQIDVVPRDDSRVPPRLVKRLMRCGPLRVL